MYGRQNVCGGAALVSMFSYKSNKRHVLRAALIAHVARGTGKPRTARETRSDSTRDEQAHTFGEGPDYELPSDAQYRSDDDIEQ